MAAATARIPSTIELDTHGGEHDPDTQSVALDQSASGINDDGTASPVADSTVRDGRSGWIIVLGCAIQTFLF